MPKWKPLQGQKFGKLLVLADYRKDDEPTKYKHWCKCICDCGNTVDTKATNLARGHKISCGKCIYIKHGMTNTRFYSIYVHMKRRCEDTTSTRYSRYGGRGIKCEWNNFQEFYDDMYKSYQIHYLKHNGDTTIDRIDNDGNYCKENCRWLTNKEQQANKSCTQGIYINGMLLSIKEYCRQYNIKYKHIQYIGKKHGISLKEALLEFLRQKEGNNNCQNLMK